MSTIYTSKNGYVVKHNFATGEYFVVKCGIFYAKFNSFLVAKGFADA